MNEEYVDWKTKVRTILERITIIKNKNKNNGAKSSFWTLVYGLSKHFILRTTILEAMRPEKIDLQRFTS